MMNQSNMDIEETLRQLNAKLHLSHTGFADVSVEEMTASLNTLLEVITVDYKTYKENIATVLALLEKYQATSIAALVPCFFSLYSELIETKDLVALQTPEAEYDERVAIKFKDLLEMAFEQESKVRISDFKLDTTRISEQDRDEIINYNIDQLQDITKKLSWDEDLIHGVMIQLPVLRALLIDSGNVEPFYFLLGLVMDRYSSSEYYQQSRDLAEEIQIASYQDNLSHWGYLVSFRCYSATGSVIPALLYASCSLFKALNFQEKVTNKYVKEVIWQGVKFFRNIGLYPWAKKIYEDIPPHLGLDSYEKRSIAHTYFTTLLQMMDENLPSLILDYLNENREDIYQTGIHDALPWLLTLYNVRRLYPKADFSSTGLGHYLATFELIVPEETVKNQKAIIEGDLKTLKPLLKESLLKLSSTRNASDLVHDNTMAIKIASRLVENAIIEKDFEALLLAIMIKSDFSLVFQQKDAEEFAPLIIPETTTQAFENTYGSIGKTLKALNTGNDQAFLWLVKSENRLYCLELTKNQFSCLDVSSWNLRDFKKLINNGFFSKLTFDETNKSTSGMVHTILPEEHSQQSDQYIAHFEFFRLSFNDYSASPLLMVMDMDLAGWPHNLLLNKEGEPIYQKRPVGNVLSTEWYIQYANKCKLKRDYTKSIWIPTTGGDFTINLLHGKLEDVLVEEEFQITTNLEPDEPIASDINIICAHGGSDIALKQVIFPDDHPRMNLDKYIGKGKVLIFFVCHSGSVRSTPFENSISSIIKRYIGLGYSSIIAPFWALHVSIPPVWLRTFISNLNNGMEIINAVNSANLVVHEKYPTIAASACLHLYGDPHVSVID